MTKSSSLRAALFSLTMAFQSVASVNAQEQQGNVVADGILKANDFLNAADAVSEGLRKARPLAKTLKVTGSLGDASKSIDALSRGDYGRAASVPFGGAVRGPLIVIGAVVGTTTIPVPGVN